MKIAQQLKEKNIAEYLIYMWQVEDLLRAHGCDIDRLRQNLVSHYPAEEQEAETQWYGHLCDMMRLEGVTEKGHLQICRNVLLELIDLHARLLSSTCYPFYNAAYFKALPFIVELRRKGNHPDEPELETCFDALYGVLLLRLQKKEITPETSQAVKAITSFLSLLANYYDKDSKGELDFQN